ncbi:hypothetical protein SmJEL517_g01519 [Synchytrium microbalum]|uniref:Cytochrome P450 n=1 Tax=Synchytrium microbalum TaxID=1806994 RepID=A0A507CEK9_9FUNG|nr:uncharacterized protein SmJEL517_g01519 [Synchytrium microbalum]TPX36344.1 hypothetical protein SmJEL517_g01519 [Synchytrium microbalum]
MEPLFKEWHRILNSEDLVIRRLYRLSFRSIRLPKFAFWNRHQHATVFDPFCRRLEQTSKALKPIILESAHSVQYLTLTYMDILSRNIWVYGHLVPKYSDLMFNIYSTHRGDWDWNEPSVLDPKRFNHPIPDGAFIPFGEGPMKFLVADPKAAQQILNGSGDEFYRDGTLQKGFTGVADLPLFAIPSGDTWYRHRKILSPSFSVVHLHHAFDEAVKASQFLVNVWKTQPANKVSNLHYDFSMLALDVIGLVGFFQSLGSLNTLIDGQKSESYRALERLANLVLFRTIAPPLLWELLNLGKAQMAPDGAFMRSIVAQVLETKLASKVVKADKDMDVLDRLLAKSVDGEAKFTHSEIIDEIFGFYAAGHETTSNTLTFCAASMMLHPECKAKLVAEIDSVLGGASPTYQDLPKLKYMDNFINEVQRYYAVVHTVPRRSRVDTQLCDDVDVFDPQRFNKPPPPGAFLPFGAGPMACIGQRMSLTELKAALVVILQQVDFNLVPGQDLEPIAGVTQGLKKGLLAKITPQRIKAKDEVSV